MFKKRNCPNQNAYRSTFGNAIKELDPRKAYKHFGIEESFDIRMRKEI